MTWVHASDARLDLAPDELVLLLGGKAANIATMAVELGLPVPPACTITTEACRAFLATGWPDGLDEELRAQVARLEERVGRRFGDAADPLLVSVRSGAPRSMPGMMDTILNLGLNDATEAGLAAASGDPAFARDCHERFRATYRSVVGVEAPEDPWQQLRGAIEAVFRSWTSDRAATYRRVEGIPDDLGTGVTIQAMVFGNLGADSGTGVLFTRNPATGEDEPYGDVLFDAQGEDVVAGTHATEPIAVLDARLPAVAAELRRDAGSPRAPLPGLLRHRVHDRARPPVAAPGAGRQADAAGRGADGRGHGRGPGVPADARGGGGAGGVGPRGPADGGDGAWLGGGAAHPRVGRVAGARVRSGAGDGGRRDRGCRDGRRRDPRAARDLARRRRGDGAGGRDPHRDGRLREPCRRRGTRLGEARGRRRVRGAGGRRRVLDRRAVIPRGRRSSRSTARPATCSKASRRAWRRSYPRRRCCSAGHASSGSGSGRRTSEQAPGSAEAGVASADDALRALLVKGYAQADQLGHALGVAADEAQALLDALVADGTAEAGAGAFRLTAVGREQATALIAEDRETWGADAATGALDAFLDLDQRMKAVVTDWQTRGPETLNDHTDAAYDAAVLARLADLHRDVEAWLSPLAAALPRLARYGARLGAAAEAAAAGNGKFVASPRVDSYHGAWFELHEDLILLAGRTRADEVAAGRA